MRAKKETPRHVVDTNLLCGAPSATSLATPGPGKLFLLKLREVRHRIVITPAIKAEYDKYQSRFSSRWVSEMRSKNLVYDARGDWYSSLKLQIQASAFGPVQKQEMLDDRHLIAAALETDRLVSSGDEQARGLFQRAVRELSGADQHLKDIVWVNPTIDAEKAIDWLEAGAPNEEHRRLGYLPRSAGKGKGRRRPK